MHFNNVLAYVPAKLRLFWDRVTSSRITVIYFIFSVLHCIIQVIFQIQAYTINDSAVNFLSGIIAQGNASQPGFAVLGPDLRWCSTVPNTVDASSCPIVWQGINNVAGGAQNVASALKTNSSSAESDTVPGTSSGSVSSSSLPSATSSVASSPSELQVSSSASSLASSSVSSNVAPPSSSSLSLDIPSVGASSTAPSDTAPLSSASSSFAASSSSLSLSSSFSSSASSTASLTPVLNAASPSSTSTLTVTVQKSSSSAASQSSSTSSVAQSSSTDSVSQSSTEEQSSAPTPATQTLTVVLKPTSGTVSVLNGDHAETISKRVDAPRVFAAISTDGQKQVRIDGLNGTTSEVTLDQKCLLALNWPVVENTKREDIVFICFQFWVLGMSLVAILNESIPHIFASLFTHILATAWGGFQIFHTARFRANFVRLTVNGACGINLLPTYWKGRANAEIPSLVLNAAALLVSTFLTWRLVKLFGWQTFKRVGASLIIRRIYNAVLVLSIIIQLSAFFIVVSGGLWLDQVINGNIAKLTTNAAGFKAVVIIVILLLFPWLALGWISVRREYKLTMLLFLVLSFLYLVGWSSMFASATFRWTFSQWTFFSLMAAASVILAGTTFVLGLYCRVNFGKGLTRYLNSEHMLEDEFTPVNGPSFFSEKGDMEKVDFPSNLTPIPTFSATLGPGAPPPAHMGYAPRIMGPRFFANSPSSYESSTTLSGGALSPTGYGGANHQRSMTMSSGHSSISNVGPPEGLNRHGSGSSQHSHLSTSSGDTQRSKTKQRWIIE
ncbi:unnamed protein product [Somion occarium]|uniref:Uncharacterized protein n=1 Tax=Somion occarium TaxID=3059160 RepID=A0ABP1CKU7_9APHY